MKLCMIGNRGHNNLVLAGLERMLHVKVVGLAPGTDDVAGLQHWYDLHGHTPRYFDGYRKMLDVLEPDVATVCGPFEQHAEMSIEALQRGISVFCEKPVAVTMEGLSALKAAYAAAKARFPNLHFVAMLAMRYDAPFHTAWRAVREGIIGIVRLINTRKSYKLGTRGAHYLRRETYGGSIPWVGSHSVDWMPWFSGEKFVSVYATHSTRYNRGHGDMEMSALCHFTMTNQVFASASIDYLRPPTAPTHGDDRVRIAGTEGVIEVRNHRVFLINGTTEGEVEMPASCDRQIFADFVAHIEGRSTALLDAKDTFTVMEACLLARQSADEGRVVHFPLE